MTRDFGTGTRGFSAADDPGFAVCVAGNGTGLRRRRLVSVGQPIRMWRTKTIYHRTAVFRQVNKVKLAAHHDALEFPDGRIMLLALLCEGEAATVLQLPAQPTNAAEVREQERFGFLD